jgi:hypothetical protein
MPYVMLDDKFPEHPKIDVLSDAAFRLMVAGICYCNRHTTDGLVHTPRVDRLVPKFKPSTLRELTDGDEPLWLPGDGGFDVHDYLDWNKSRAQIEAQSARQSERARKRWS